MKTEVRRRTAALLEVLGVYLTAGFLEDKIVELLVLLRLFSPANPFALLTTHTSNSELLVASRQLSLIWILQYGCYFLLIVPLNWWYRRRGTAAYGLTRAGHSWNALILAALATAVLTQWPVLLHTLVDAIHPLGAMEPWRQAFFDMSWRRWQFWVFAGMSSFAVVPVVEELLFRGYYQRRLAEDRGDGPAILGTACFFAFSHKQYLVANAYNVSMMASLLCFAIGLGVVFAWTRSLLPSMVAHALINIPMTPLWQGALLVVFAGGIFFVRRGGVAAIKQVFRHTNLAPCLVLVVALTIYVIAAQRSEAMTWVSIGMLAVALGLEAMDRRINKEVGVASLSA